MITARETAIIAGEFAVHDDVPAIPTGNAGGRLGVVEITDGVAAITT